MTLSCQNRTDLTPRNTIYRVIITLCFIYGLISCSVEKNTSLSRNYHNLTSHYNIYFNGNESFKRGVTKAGKSIQLDFNKVLPVFLYEDESVHNAVRSDMKRSIDKATKVITFHSITAKPKVKEGNQSPRDKVFYEKNEYNKWMDDSYMLMGKAYMYQGEFFLAAETFKHVLITFPNEPVRYLAMTWLARAYIMIGEMREAERILQTLADESAFPEAYLLAYHTTGVQYHLHEEDYTPAIEDMNLVLEQKGIKKSDRIRYTYILAQLYEETGQDNLALEKYRKVTRYNPPYEMAFNARVSMAEVYTSGSANSADLKKLLTKMLKDSKNTEYKDQIYFALGNIAMEEGERQQAIEYYQLSVSSSMKNRYQKGYSSLTLAQLYYEDPDYMLSAAYYDSAVTFLDKDYPGYSGLVSLSASLSQLVYNVNIYEREDSLQMLAGLPEKERLALIDGIIEKVRQEEEEARLAEQQAMQDMAFNQSMMFSNRPGGGNSGTQGGQWYFYNLNAKSFGQPEFRMKWGERTLEDNWRRKNKQTVSQLTGGATAEGDSAGTGDGTPVLDNKSREFYLVNIPMSDSAMTASNERLRDALYNMGVIYKEKLLDYPESISAFEEMLQRYPTSSYTASAYYYLYELNNSTGNPARAEFYKARLSTEEYRETHYAKLLNNPNYLKELEEEEMKVVRYYEEVYAMYQQKDYAGVISRVDSALLLFPDDPLTPKFIYIQALSTGALHGEEEMKTTLDTLIARYPETEESLQAREIIDYMYVEFPEIKEADQAQEAEVIYGEIDPGQEHYFLLALHKSQDINKVSFDLLNYNLDHFNQYDLHIEPVELNGSYQMVSVQTFTNAEGAFRYLTVIQENSDTIMAGIDPSQYRLMIISLDNFKVLVKEKAFNPYYLFYQSHYQNMK